MADIPFGAPLTLKEVAHALGYSESTIRRLVKDGLLSRPRRSAAGKPRWFEGDVAVYRYRLARGDFDPASPVEIGEVDDAEED